MYVYIARFSNRPGLIKIGFSEDAYQRVKHLEREHGSGEVLVTLYAGYKAKYVEFRTHKMFANFRKKVSGVGGNEFFDDTIVDEVVAYIRSVHLPLELEAFLKEEQKQLARCMEFSRSLLRKSMGKARKGDTTFNGQKHRITLGVQILMEHGMTSNEAYTCYANLLNRTLGVRRQRLTGWRLRVAITCSDWGPVMDRSPYSVKYRSAISAREEMETKLNVEKRNYYV